MYRKICGLMFALLISVSVFGGNFDIIKSGFVNDSTGLDTSAYIETLQRMYGNEKDQLAVYLAMNPASKKAIKGTAECQKAIDEIEKEILTLAGLDSAEIDEMEKSGDFPTTESVIGGTALLAIYALLRKKKSGKVPTAQELIVDYFGKMPEDSKIDVQQLYRALTPIETSSVWRNSTIKLWLEFNGVHFYKSWTKAKLLKAVTDYVEA